ncbi:hypothetical protein D8S78_01975 [Natrialba swarupiae]|nr:hypothetical protein [Natrialba swarupiae]
MVDDGDRERADSFVRLHSSYGFLSWEGVSSQFSDSKHGTVRRDCVEDHEPPGWRRYSSDLPAQPPSSRDCAGTDGQETVSL